MSEDPPEEQQTDESRSWFESLEQLDPDEFLTALQQAANQTKGSTALTLMVGGLVISGALVGGQQFYERLAGDRAATPAGDDTVVEMLRRKAQDYDVEPEEVPEPLYVHLVDAWIHAPTGAVKVGAWRGRLSRVDGWTLGEIRPSE